MSFELEFPEDTSTGGTRLEKIGWYHVRVLSVDEEPTNYRNEMIDGFEIHVAVLDGDNPDQKKKELHQTFYNPKLTDRDLGEFGRKKQARFCLATDIMPRGPHKPGDKVLIDLQDAFDRQLVIKTQWQKDKETKKPTEYVELAFAEMYHVDDPAVANVAKDAAALLKIPPEMRKTPEDFGSGGGDEAKRKAEELLNDDGESPSESVSIGDL